MSLNYINKLHVLKNITPIILLSHMRANTSLFGHILGSNPQINGYYEMHIGYYSWKSLIRQKLKFLEKHKFKKNSHFIFDKVLHNEHYVNCKLLKDKESKLIISLRPPNETIPSILKLYSKINPKHVFSSQEGAINYYIKRLEMLEQYSKELKNTFIYLDANDIKQHTYPAFHFLEKNLGLETPLDDEYKVQKMTGEKFAGDHSEALKNGKINYSKSDFSDINIDSKAMDDLIIFHKKIKLNIINNSKKYFKP